MSSHSRSRLGISSAWLPMSSIRRASGVGVDAGGGGVGAAAAAYSMQADSSASKVRIMAGSDQRRGIGGRAATNCASVPLSRAASAASSSAERIAGWVRSMFS